MDYAKVIKLPQFFRNVHRVSEIMAVLVRHGFGDLVNRLNVAYGKTLKIVKPSIRHDTDKQVLDVATRLRLVCEDLGPTFIKMGQLIATRPDVFPRNIIEEFRKLQDKVAPFPSEVAIATIEEEFHTPINVLFSDFSKTPLAAGSIAQVHKATLIDGSTVVVKIQRPDIERLIDTDMEIVKGLVSLFEEAYPEMESFDLPLIIEEFHRTLKQGCDFIKEAQNMTIFASQHRLQDILVVPKTYPELCSRLIITQEFINGTKVTDLCKTGEIPSNADELVETLASVILDSIFKHRFFHADPHPGNIIITTDQKLALIDFGEMGRLDKERMRTILALLAATLSKNPEKILHIMRENRMTPPVFDEASVRVQITAILDAYIGKTLASLNFSMLLTEIFDVVRRYGIKPPADILMIVKSITLLEAMATVLSPEFDPVSVLKPYITRQYFKTFSDPKLRLETLDNTLESYKHLTIEFPYNAREILSNLSRGETTFQTVVKNFSTIKTHQNRMLNRVLVIVLGIFFVSIGLLFTMQTDGLKQILGYFFIFCGAISLLRGWWAIRRNDGL
jgi:ubiquinone biosynthesis protein